MNILSFDIEEWYIERKFNGGRKDRYELFDSYLYNILDCLDALQMKATFFCVGKIATEFPYVVKKIAERGHEIGCHSNEHLWLTKMSPAELKADTTEALHALQDAIGHKVISYRAPAFSIGEKNKWAFEILSECGIERDASIFPAVRDFGGFTSFPTDNPVIIESNGGSIKEFPISLTRILGNEIAYSGGGYFRFFPLWYIKNQLRKSEYFIAYFHIGDLIHNKGGMMTKKEYENYFREPGTIKNRIVRYIKSNIGTKGSFTKMRRLLGSAPFINLEEADKQIASYKIVSL